MSLEWMIIRGSGIAAFAALSAATIWGLLVSSKLFGRLVKSKPLTWFHESLAIAALLATLGHVVVLSKHEFLEFTLTEIMIPGTSDWRRGAVAFGVVALYGLVIVVGSFYIKKLIGHRTWRLIHFSTLGVFLASLIHGVSAGTDTRTPIMIGLYLGSAGIIAVLLATRLTGVGEDTRTKVAGRAGVSAAPDADGHEGKGQPALGR
jgi:predicted ferric reductase